MKGNTMSKIKDYIVSSVEKQVDKIMKLDNLELVGIDENNIDEVVDDIFYDQKESA